MSGRLLTFKVKLASVVAPQLSVARIVMVCVPAGAALLIETTPVVLPTLIVPVYVPKDCTTMEDTVKLSDGPVAGLILSDPARATP